MSAIPVPAQRKDYGALAQKLESMHGWCIAQYAASLMRMRPSVGAAILPVAGGIAIYTGPSPFSFTVGAGMAGPVSVEEIDAIEDFFRLRQHSVRVDITPFTHPGLLETLLSRGYRRSEFTSVLVLDLGALPGGRPGTDDARRSSPDARGSAAPERTVVRWAGLEECNRWIEVIAHCFFVDDPGPERRANMAALFHVPGSLNTFTSVGNEVVGVAGGMIHPDGDLVALFGSATLPRFRRRGIHHAMLDFRLNHARSQGCKLALITATPGSTSERNLMRYGFVECYQKVTYAK